MLCFVFQFCLEIRKFTGYSNSERIAEVLTEQIWNIPGRTNSHTVSMVTDSAANILKSLREMDVVSNNVRCLGHLINNAILEAFKHNVLNLVTRCKHIAAATHRSHKTCEVIKKHCALHNVKYAKVIQPVKTRWHSMADCMSSILKLRKALEEIKDREDRSDAFIGKLIKAIPTKSQFDVLAALIPKLMHIKGISERLTADTTPTIHLVIPTLVALSRLDSEFIVVQEFLKTFQNYLSDKIDNCGREDSNFALAAFLHPHYKGAVLHYKLSEVRAKSKPKGKKKVAAKTKTASQRDLIDDDEDDEDEAHRPETEASAGGLSRRLSVSDVLAQKFQKDIFESTKDHVINLMRKSRLDRGVSPIRLGGHDAHDAVDEDRPGENLDDAMADWMSVNDFLSEGDLSTFADPKAVARGEDQLERQVEDYLNLLPKLSKADGDILAYWRSHSTTVPDLARLARKVLAIPASSATSERLFSAAGRTISDQRTNLSGQRAEQLVFIQQNYVGIKDTIERWDLGLPREDKGKGKGKKSGKDVSPDPTAGLAGPSSSGPRTSSTKANPPDAGEDLSSIPVIFDEEETSDPEYAHSEVDLDLVPSDAEYDSDAFV